MVAWYYDLASREKLIAGDNGLEQLQKMRKECMRRYHPDKLGRFIVSHDVASRFGRDVLEAADIWIKTDSRVA